MSAYWSSQHGRITLGKELGKGGEGSVYEIVGHPRLVAKIYIGSVSPDKAEKLRAMASRASQQLLEIAAWPTATVHRDLASGPIVGLIMPRVPTSQPIHQLYSPKNRRAEFPSADWRFLVHVATNLARAVATIHQSGIVIGDINPGNIHVSAEGVVMLVDCDSYQLVANGKRYLCEVGMQEFTPPELLGKSFSHVVRSEHHDAFGLAVTIFHLLMMGRHPFAGVYRDGRGEMTLERSIKEYRFAYGPVATSREMKPPPNSVPMHALPPQLAEMFTKAFATQHPRPLADTWISALTALSGKLRRCSTNQAHYFPADSKSCPWCELDLRGASFFSHLVTAYRQVAYDLQASWAAIQAVGVPIFATPTVGRATTSTPTLERLLRRICLGVLVFAIIILITPAADPGTLRAQFGLSTSPLWLVIGLLSGVFTYAIGSLNSVQYLRKQRDEAFERWKRETSADEFNQLRKRLESARSDYENLSLFRDQGIAKLRTNLRDKQFRDYLDNVRIQHARIPGLNSTQRAGLLSFGIESATDINEAAVMQVYGIGPATTRRLIAWRQQVEAAFVFDPKKGIDKRDLEQLEAEVQKRALAVRTELDTGPQRLRQIRETLERKHAEFAPVLAEAMSREAFALGKVQAIRESAKNDVMTSAAVSTAICLVGGLFLNQPPRNQVATPAPTAASQIVAQQYTRELLPTDTSVPQLPTITNIAVPQNTATRAATPTQQMMDELTRIQKISSAKTTPTPARASPTPRPTRTIVLMPPTATSPTVIDTSTPEPVATTESPSATPEPTASNTPKQSGSRMCPRPEVCITSPENGAQAYRGTNVMFTGTATRDGFQRYKFSVRNRDTGAVGTVAEFWKPVSSGELMRLDTGSMPAGRYTFMLTVIDDTGNSFAEVAEVDFEIR